VVAEPINEGGVGESLGSFEDVVDGMSLAVVVYPGPDTWGVHLIQWVRPTRIGEAGKET
jgi:hypothetical protein